MLPRHDHNRAFAKGVTLTHPLSESLKVIYIEVGDAVEGSMLLRKIACLRGTNEEGDPLYPIDHLVISFHGEQSEIDPGGIEDEEPPENRVSMTNEALLEEWGRYVVTGGTQFLNACLTAHGGRLADNLANRIKYYSPHSNLIAFEQVSSGSSALRLSFNLGKMDVIAEKGRLYISEALFDENV